MARSADQTEDTREPAPEARAIRRHDAMKFDGSVFFTVWVAQYAHGPTGGTILIEGLEQTQTDVLVHYKTRARRNRQLRLNTATPSFAAPEPLGKAGISSPISASALRVSRRVWTT